MNIADHAEPAVGQLFVTVRPEGTTVLADVGKGMATVF